MSPNIAAQGSAAVRSKGTNGGRTDTGPCAGRADDDTIPNPHWLRALLTAEVGHRSPGFPPCMSVS